MWVACMRPLHKPTNLAKRNVGTGRDLSEVSPLERSRRPTRKGFTPPLRGSVFPLGKTDRGRAVCAKADVVGGHATEKAPPTNSPAGFALVSLSGFPLGKPDPQGKSGFPFYLFDNDSQGGSEIQRRRKITTSPPQGGSEIQRRRQNNNPPWLSFSDSRGGPACPPAFVFRPMTITEW